MVDDTFSKRIALLEKKVAIANQNMIELSQVSSFDFLMDSHRQPGGLTGTTKTATEPVLETIDRLWDYLKLINALLVRAKKLNSSPLLSPARREELQKLLFGPSVLLPASPVPLSDRALLTPALNNQYISADELLCIAVDAFGKAKEFILKIEKEIGGLQDSINSGREQIEIIARQTNLARVGQLHSDLADIERLSFSDPLEAARKFETVVKPGLLQIQGMATRQQVMAQHASTLCLTASVELEALSMLHQECNMLEQSCQEDIDSFVPKSRRPEFFKRLCEWLSTLQTNLAAGENQAVCTGGDNWWKMSRMFRASEEEAKKYYAALVEERQELRGLLCVYKTRAARHGVVEDSALSDMAAEAEFHLYHPQRTPLPLVRALVEKYAARLNTLSKTFKNAGQ